MTTAADAALTTADYATKDARAEQMLAHMLVNECAFLFGLALLSLTSGCVAVLLRNETFSAKEDQGSGCTSPKKPPVVSEMRLGI